MVAKNIDLMNNFIQLKSDLNNVKLNLAERTAEMEKSRIVKTAQIYRELPVVEPQVAPDFDKKLESAVVLIGARHSFDCSIIGSQPFEIQWSKNGINLDNDPNWSMLFNEKTGMCSLVLHRATSDDNALFSCKVTNELGLAETSAYLKVKGKSPLNLLNDQNNLLIND